MAKELEKIRLRAKRKMRIRSKVSGTAERPRLSVFRSAKHIFAQVINDLTGETLVSVGSFKKGETKRANKPRCTELGRQLAERCKAKNITTIVFDKNGFAYHGRLKALADGAREGGMKF